MISRIVLTSLSFTFPFLLHLLTVNKTPLCSLGSVSDLAVKVFFITPLRNSISVTSSKGLTVHSSLSTVRHPQYRLNKQIDNTKFGNKLT